MVSAPRLLLLLLLLCRSKAASSDESLWERPGSASALWSSAANAPPPSRDPSLGVRETARGGRCGENGRSAPALDDRLLEPRESDRDGEHVGDPSLDGMPRPCDGVRLWRRQPGWSIKSSTPLWLRERRWRDGDRDGSFSASGFTAACTLDAILGSRDGSYGRQPPPLRAAEHL